MAQRDTFDRYLNDASQMSLENAMLCRQNEIAKARRATFAEIDMIFEAGADVRDLQREIERRKKLLKVVESPAREGAA
jgi:hypothetical protein